MSPTSDVDGGRSTVPQRLGASRRHQILDILTERSDSMDIEELAAELVVLDDDPTIITEESIEGVTIALHHVHLPKLEDEGVRYDPSTRRIELDEPSFR